MAMCEYPAALRPLVHFALWSVRLAKATTQTTPGERALLARHASGRRLLAEIGVWQGVTTRRLRAAMAPDGEIWAIDPYDRGRLGVSFPELVARREVELVENGTVRWIRETGQGAAARWQKEGRPPLEFLFIDGDHSLPGITADWNAWSGLMAKGGRVALHDSRSTPEREIHDAGSIAFTRDVIVHDVRYRVVDEVESVTVLERVG